MVLFLIAIASFSFRYVDAFAPTDMPFSLRGFDSKRGYYSTEPLLGSVSKQASDSIFGLLDDETFFRYSNLNTTLTNLRNDLPRIKTSLLSSESARTTYAENVTLVGTAGEILSFGMDELIALSASLVFATRAARRLESPFSDGELVGDLVDATACRLVMDSEFSKIGVEWETGLIGPASSDPTGSGKKKLKGLSELALDENGLVRSHKIIRITLQGQDVNVRAVGETIGALRKTLGTFVRDSPLLKSVQDSPIGKRVAQKLPSFGEMILSQATSLLSENMPGGEGLPIEDGRSQIPVAPLYVTDFWNTTEFKFNETLVTSIDTVSPTHDLKLPLPGSLNWGRYATSHQSLTSFINCAIPLLSGETKINKMNNDIDIYNLFSTDVVLYGLDGSISIQGSNGMADMYRTLASFRKATNAIWKIVNVTVNDWEKRIITLKWLATSTNNPAVEIEGVDQFTLNVNYDATCKVDSVRQLSLTVAGNPVNPDWVRRFNSGLDMAARDNFVSFLTTNNNVLADLLVQARPGTNANVDLTSTLPPPPPPPPMLSDDAALSLYAILRTLHRDYPTLTGNTNSDDPISVPAEEYITKDVKFVGLLGETLLRGSANYKQFFRLLITSLRASMQTGRVYSEVPPIPKIEFTPTGTVRVTLVMKLRVDATPPSFVPNSGEFSKRKNGIPLKLEIVSEYVLDNSDGKIVQHRLLESRINGQLTPADVLTRWISGVRDDSLFQNNDGNLPVVRAMLDALAWARAIGK